MVRVCALLVMFVMVACHTDSSTRLNTRGPAANHPCAAATPEALMEIQVVSGSAVSICRSDGIGDCLYSAEAGRTFVTGRPDFDQDGQPDMLVRDFSGAYGNHDVVHFLGYVTCSTGEFVKVLDTFATTMELTDEPSASAWRDMTITRDCFDEPTQDVVSRRFRLSWHESASIYGPPDDDFDLTQHCTMKEMALPPM